MLKFVFGYLRRSERYVAVRGRSESRSKPKRGKRTEFCSENSRFFAIQADGGKVRSTKRKRTTNKDVEAMSNDPEHSLVVIVVDRVLRFLNLLNDQSVSSHC